jgi:hypothetical protein
MYPRNPLIAPGIHKHYASPINSERTRKYEIYTVEPGYKDPHA